MEILFFVGFFVVLFSLIGLLAIDDSFLSAFCVLCVIVGIILLCSSFYNLGKRHGQEVVIEEWMHDDGKSIDAYPDTMYQELL